MGVSLGAPRILHLESTGKEGETFDILLDSGSVYLQKDSIRYGYEHSILKNGFINGIHHEGGQRLSVMIRDTLHTSHTSTI